MARSYIPFETLKGLTIESIDGSNKGSEEILFTTSDGRDFKMYHSQDCCESVSVEEIIGDLNDIIGSEILLAEEVESGNDPEGYTNDSMYRESFTWTFYKLSTIKGSVTIRWLGESNGYYSESVSFQEV